MSGYISILLLRPLPDASLIQLQQDTLRRHDGVRWAAGCSLCGLPSVISYVPLMDGELAGTPFRPPRLHSIYRLRVERDGDSVRLITRGGYDWTKRFPWIAHAAKKNRVKRF